MSPGQDETRVCGYIQVYIFTWSQNYRTTKKFPTNVLGP